MRHIFVEIDQQNGTDIHATIMAKNLHLCKLYSKKKLLDCSNVSGNVSDVCQNVSTHEKHTAGGFPHYDALQA